MDKQHLRGPQAIADILDRLVTVAEGDSRAPFTALALAAGLDPARDFIGASLQNIDFRDEDLRGCNFSRADLTGCDFRRANLAGVRFDGATLTGVIGLLVPAVPLFSCFLSYSHLDFEFAEKLHADLQAAGVRCWFAPHDLPVGSKVIDVLDQEIKRRDKVLLIISSASVRSSWVELEIKGAVAEEQNRNAAVLLPISIDDEVFRISTESVRELLAGRAFADFRSWRDQRAYEEAFSRLLDSLIDHTPLPNQKKSSISRFGQLVAEADKPDISLPFLHVVSGYEFRNIMRTGMLAAKPAAHYPGENLVYFFYGRPAYRVRDVEGQAWMLPICFVIRPDAVKMAKRIFPFDSGAILDGYARDVMHPDMLIDNFELEADTSSAGRMVGLFYGSNERYFEGNPRDTSIGNALDFEVNVYQRMSNSERLRRPDDHASTIEIQVEHDVSVSDAAMAVILPSQFVDNPEVAEKLNKWKLDILTYDSSNLLMSQGAYNGVIKSMLRSYFLKKGYLRGPSTAVV